MLRIFFYRYARNWYYRNLKRQFNRYHNSLKHQKEGCNCFSYSKKRVKGSA